MKRNFPATEKTSSETRFAEMLRLLPPYTLDKAEENFRTLIKLEHPDATSQSPEHNARAADLNDAIEFFRKNSAPDEPLVFTL